MYPQKRVSFLARLAYIYTFGGAYLNSDGNLVGFGLNRGVVRASSLYGQWLLGDAEQGSNDPLRHVFVGDVEDLRRSKTEGYKGALVGHLEHGDLFQLDADLQGLVSGEHGEVVAIHGHGLVA
jgi:hypothetical protein